MLTGRIVDSYTNIQTVKLFAHTSPVYVDVAGRRTFDRPTAQRLLDRIKWGRREVLEKGRFPDESAKARVVDVYDEALAALERRMREAQ